MKTLIRQSLNIFKVLTEDTSDEIDYKRIEKEIVKLNSLLNEAYLDIKSMRESGDAGNWNETELEKRIKKQLGLK